MTPRHRVSRAAIELLKRFEGFRARAAELPDGRWTVGHGHTLTARQGAEVSEKDAEDLLLYDLVAVAYVINESVFAPLTQNQFDALCSFAFNVGADNFRQSSVLRRLNEGQHLQAACAMEMWRQAEVGGERIVVDALVRRRSAEKTLFLTPVNAAWLPAPSPILRPLVDAGARDLVPNETPAPVSTTLDGERLILVRHEADEAEEGAIAPPTNDVAHPVAAAAEVVQARLQALFQESSEDPHAAPDPEIAAELEVGSEPGPEAEPEAVVELRPQVELEPPVEPIAAPEARDDEAIVTEPPVAEPAGAESQAAAVDDDVYPFRQPIVATPRPQPAGLVSLLLLAVIGLAFFAGGLFWGTNATASVMDELITPQIVGVLACLTGIVMFSIAAFVLLSRLGHAAESEDD